MAIEVKSPFPVYAWPLVWQWIQTFRDRVCDDFSPATCEQFVGQMLGEVRPADSWGVYRDGELGGLVWVARVNPILGYSHMVFSRAFWGRETTTEAVAQVFDQVFASGVEKIVSAAFEDNHQVRALARSIGVVEEGRRRQHTRRRGKPVDLIDFGLLKADFYAHRNTGSVGDLGNSECGRGSGLEPDRGRQDLDQLHHAHATA